MERNDDFERRTVLRGAAGVLAAGVLAGCSGGNGSDGSGGDSGSGENGTTGDSGGGTGTEAGTGPTSTETVSNTETGGTSGQNAQVEQWLAGANNYNGSIADMTGSDTVEIAVGAGSDGFAFDPAAVRVSPDTTIRWTWTGRGGAHNVVAQGGAFDSGPPQVGENVTYEATLDQPGIHLYYCEPHRRLGMKGAVVVSG
jgi:halocyanin-like protein